MTENHSRITLTLLFILANFKFGDFTPEIIVQSDGNFTLRPNVQGHLDEILWRWNGDKVVEFDQKEVVDYRQFKGRTFLNLTTGALTLTRLTESDSGRYDGELQIKGLLEYHSQTVKVFDAVDKPAVTCQVKGTSVTLLCSGDNRPTTEYRWEGPAIEPQPGPQLEIEAAESSDSVYTCVLQNPVSQSRTDFPVKSCFPAPETSVIIPLVIVLVLLICVTVGLLLFYYKKRYKKRRNEKDPEGQPGEWKRQEEEDSERKQLLSVDTEVVEETPVKVLEIAKRLEAMGGTGKTSDKHQERTLTELPKGTVGSAGISQESQAEGQNAEDTVGRSSVTVSERVKQFDVMVSPDKTSDKRQKRTQPEQPKGTDGSAGISQKSQAESLNEVVESEERVQTEGRNSPEHPSSGTDLSSAPVSPSAVPPKTGSEDNTNRTPESKPPKPPPKPPKPTPHSAQAPIQSQDQEEEPECRDETHVEEIPKAEDDQLSHTSSISTDVPQTSLSPPRPGQPSGQTEEQEEETESSDETADLVEKIFKAEDDQLSHKTISTDDPKTSPSPSRPGQASGQTEEQEEEAESSDETGANERTGAQSQREEGQGLDGGIDEGGAPSSGAEGANLEPNSTSQAQEEEEEEGRGRRPPEKPPIPPNPPASSKPSIPSKPLSWTVPEHTGGRDSGQPDTASHD